MILLADSGSTKTDWCWLDRGVRLGQIRTPGIHPFFESGQTLTDTLRAGLCPALPSAEPVDAVYFYGAGCTPEASPRVHEVLAGLWPSARIEVRSDMLGAARALCGHSAGIACILGTGSNSCHYNGSVIDRQVPPLGFILGDEGSGASLGKRLVADLLKNQLPAALKQEFLEKFQLTEADIIDRVYRRPYPNRFLAGLSPFLSCHLDHPDIRRLVSDEFARFLTRNVMQYDWADTEVHFTGSVAYHYQSLLLEVCHRLHLRAGHILQTPLDGLAVYHGQNVSY